MRYGDMKHFHYIIAGAGCAGLSLLVRLLQSGQAADKKILLVDKQRRTGKDRTWCFWEKEAGYFESIVYKSWDQLWVHGKENSAKHAIHPYHYKMIRGEDFYRYCFQLIEQYPNVEIVYGEVTALRNEASGASLQLGNETILADYIFNSILFNKPVLQPRQYYLLQHFKGWVIETTNPVFNPAEATLMDFRTGQQHGTAFVYVMPFSANRALVEYTLFSEVVLTPQEYDLGLHEYILTYVKSNYEVLAEETGAIPMTNYRFPAADGQIIHIGTAGGQTKPSTGYTFRFIQQQADQLASTLAATGKPLPVKDLTPGRFRLYDSTLLQILAQGQLPGHQIFTTLFQKNKITNVLQFLDQDTNLLQEMKIITVLPTGIFMKAAWRQLF